MNKILQKGLIRVSAMFLAIIGFVKTAFAAAQMNAATVNLGNSLTSIDTESDVWTQLGVFINYILSAIGLVVLLMLLYGGVIILTSQGSDDKIGEARKIIMYAIVGAVIIALAYALNSWIFESSFFKDVIID
ncbi:MAG: hypothetical protein NTZ80_01870 [Patescibacteria group bacterium]|nr:hypothetical protein [Patescibacteria group bacterium]